jgi:hypothetical protein
VQSSEAEDAISYRNNHPRLARFSDGDRPKLADSVEKVSFDFQGRKVRV